MEARTPEVRSVTPQRSSLPLQKLVCNRSPLVFVVPRLGSWCKAFCLIARPKSFQCCTEPSCWVITLCLYGNHQEIQCKCHVLACKKYTGEEKAIGIWCTEIKYPKFSASRSLQTVMLCRGSRTTGKGCSLHQNHNGAASFTPSLGQCLVEKGWFYGTLGREQRKSWIFSLTFLLSVNNNAAQTWHLYPKAVAIPLKLPRTGFALRC